MTRHKTLLWFALLALLCGSTIHGMKRTIQNELIAAIFAGKRGAVASLIERKAQCNYVDEYGKFPLLTAVTYNHADIAALLLFHKADVNQRDKDGDTALTIAPGSGNIDTTELLLNHKADINNINLKNDTALINVVRYGLVDMTRLLLARKANINYSGRQQYTALNYALAKGHGEITKLLVENKADINHVAMHGDTPLYIAIKNCQEQVAELLFDSNANLSIVDGKTLVAAIERDFTTIAKRLITEKAAIDYQSDAAGVALITASESRRTTMSEVVALLVKNGAPLEAVDITRKETALIKAACAHRADIAAILLAHKARVDAVNTLGETALHRSVTSLMNDDYSVIEVLIAHKADVNCTTKTKVAPLRLVARMKNNSAAISLLLNHGADVYQLDTEEFDRIDLAMKRVIAEKVLCSTQLHQSLLPCLVGIVNEYWLTPGVYSDDKKRP